MWDQGLHAFSGDSCCLERARLRRGISVVLPCSSWALEKPWRAEERRANSQGRREQRRPAAGCSHGKTHRGAQAGAARAGQLNRPGRTARAGLLSAPARESASLAEGHSRENKMLGAVGSLVPGNREPEVPMLWMLRATLPAVHTTRKGGRGWYTPGTRGAPHGHLAAAAASDGRPIEGAHRSCNGADARLAMHTHLHTHRHLHLLRPAE